jgi:hypothetical protein
LNLAPFNESALQHFAYLERPLGLQVPDGTAFRHVQHYRREIAKNLFSPTPSDYRTQGHLYHAIASGLDDLADELGGSVLFAGHDDAQVSGAQFALPGTFPVTDLASAHRAIEEIIEQGKGAPVHSDHSHFARFSLVHSELKASMGADAGGRPPVRVAGSAGAVHCFMAVVCGAARRRN